MTEEKKKRDYYSPAQKKAQEKYRTRQALTQIRTTPEKKAEIINRAQADGLSLNAWILEAIEEKLNN